MFRLSGKGCIGCRYVDTLQCLCAGFSFGGGVLQPQNNQQPGMMQGNGFMTSPPMQQQPAGDAGQQKLIQNDIDSSLVSLAGNLSVGATGKIK